MTCRCNDAACTLPPAPVDLHVCDYCGTRFRSPFSAAMCCDPISNDLDDETDLDGQPFRSIN